MRTRVDAPKILFIVFIVIWALLAIKPLYRFDWFLENIVIFLAVPLVMVSYYRFRFSNSAYAVIFIFATLHILGAHYTYGATPWGTWFQELFSLSRNHYDRFVHFLFPLFMMPIVVELLNRSPLKHRGWQIFFAASLLIMIGALYEIAEFLVGITAKPEAGLAFLGFQGDIWDTQKDMGLHVLGVVVWFFGAMVMRWVRGRHA